MYITAPADNILLLYVLYIVLKMSDKGPSFHEPRHLLPSMSKTDLLSLHNHWLFFLYFLFILVRVTLPVFFRGFRVLDPPWVLYPAFNWSKPCWFYSHISLNLVLHQLGLHHPVVCSLQVLLTSCFQCHPLQSVFCKQNPTLGLIKNGKISQAP